MAPLQQVARERKEIDSADGKTPFWFPILWAWIADHVEHAALQGIGSKLCPKWEVPCEVRGGDRQLMYETSDYMLYREKAVRQAPAEAAGIAEYMQRLGVKVGNNVFTGLDRVSPTDLHQPEPLHNIYLGLFKHMIEWVEGFLKKDKQQQVFNDAWKEIPHYAGFLVAKKAYRQMTQWQGKVMRNCNGGIL